MKTIIINNIEEMQKYYNKNTNTYEFIEDSLFLNVEFTSNIDVMSNINACDINAGYIKAWDIKARDINAGYINACDIKARDIKAGDINAGDIKARDIKAGDINYYAICFAYNSIYCNSIYGERENSKHFVLDGELRIRKEEV